MLRGSRREMPVSRMSVLSIMVLVLAGCTKPVSVNDNKTKLDGGQVSEIRTIDYNCIVGDEQSAEPFNSVNRISLDLVNNRIDMFSKDRVWQFHGVRSSDQEKHNINIEFIGKNIAAWGISKDSPYNFFFDRTGSNITFSIINGGRVQSVVYQC